MFHTHKFEIAKFCNRKGKNQHFRRICKCGEEQELVKPKKYDPSKYVWRNEQGREFDS